MPRARLLGRLADAGLGLRDQAGLAALTEDVVKTSEIEGEMLDVVSVCSSMAVHNASAACRPRSSASAGTTTTSWNARGRARWR